MLFPQSMYKNILLENRPKGWNGFAPIIPAFLSSKMFGNSGGRLKAIASNI